MPGRGGLAVPLPGLGPSFAPPNSHAIGNDLPPYVGDPYTTFKGGPHPPTQPMGNPQLGGNDGFWGSNNDPNDAGYPPLSTHTDAWTEGLWFDQSPDHQSDKRYGLQGFNDKLWVADRHAYWDTGNQTTGLEGFPPAGSPNTYNDPLKNKPRADLRTVNRDLSYQKGTDTTRNQDDLSRPYTWLGEQGSGYAPVYGGVPGLYQPYGSRGGVPYPIVSPAEFGGPGDGRHLVWAGPPHGLHSLTYPDRGDTLQRFAVNPQMRPVRVDRPSNSPQAGQSYNQTVLPQGQTRAAAPKRPWTAKVSGRGWLGTEA